MRILFVSGTVAGGSGRSQRDLAGCLSTLGHAVEFVADDARPRRASRFAYEQLSDLSVRWGRRPGARLIRAMERLPGRRSKRVLIGGAPHWCSPVPENALSARLADWRPDVVVGNSILRLAWRKVRSLCEESSIPTVLYVREEASLNHFIGGRRAADAVVANSMALAESIRALGFECAFVPSVIETRPTRTSSSREVALAIHPAESHGLELLRQVASKLTDIPFVLQESRALSAGERARIDDMVAALPNVSFRPIIPPSSALYGSARVLLVPHLVDNRPRVIVEAQANGIPVIVNDLPALRETAGEGGVAVPVGDVDAWCGAVRAMWDDGAHYRLMCEAALERGRRPEIDPECVAAEFGRILDRLVG